MGFFDWFKKSSEATICAYDIEAETNIRKLAFWSAVSIISSAVAKCEFKTYLENEEQKSEEYYMWNIQPNKNQSSSEFIHKWIAKLYANNESLIIQKNGQLFVADSFYKESGGLEEDRFKDIVVNEAELKETFNQSQVLYFKLADENVKRVIDGVCSSYSQMIAHGMNSYKKTRGVKGIFRYDTLPVAGTPEREKFDDLINNKFKDYMEKPNAIIGLGKGQEFIESGSKTYANESTRDVRALIDDVFDFTAKGLNIPPILLKGDTQGVGEVLDVLLTFCIDPLTLMLSEEINRKRSGMKAYLKGTKVYIDTRSIKHIDLLGVTSAIDKLISSGCFNVNEIRKVLGESKIEEEWADKHFMTKNYGNIEEFLEDFKKGEKDEKQIED